MVTDLDGEQQRTFATRGNASTGLKTKSVQIRPHLPSWNISTPPTWTAPQPKASKPLAPSAVSLRGSSRTSPSCGSFCTLSFTQPAAATSVKNVLHTKHLATCSADAFLAASASS